MEIFDKFYINRVEFFEQTTEWLKAPSPNHRLLSIVGTVGVGKSWFMADLYNWLDKEEQFLPIWLNLRETDADILDIVGNPIFDITSIEGREEWLAWIVNQAKRKCASIRESFFLGTFTAKYEVFTRELCQTCPELIPVLLVNGYDELVSERARDFLLEHVVHTFFSSRCTKIIMSRLDEKSLPHGMLGWNEKITVLPPLRDDQAQKQLASLTKNTEVIDALFPFLSGNPWVNAFLLNQITNRYPIEITPNDIRACLQTLLKRADLDPRSYLELLKNLSYNLPDSWTIRQLRQDLNMHVEDPLIESLFKAGFIRHIKGTSRYQIDPDIKRLLLQVQKLELEREKE
jgi:hypothetical protein